MKEKIVNYLKTKKQYPISMEIAGKFAMFSRPDTGSDKTSFPFPPFSAAKGIMESILYMPTVNVIPLKIEICSPIKYCSWAYNYNGAKRKSTLIKEENTCQMKCTILENVCYKIYGVVVNKDYEFDKLSSRAKENNKKYSNNNAHAYQCIFYRYLKQGKNQKSPHLGWSQFLASYVGPLRSSTSVSKDVNLEMPYMLFSCFDELNTGLYNPSFVQDVKVEEGMAKYVG